MNNFWNSIVAVATAIVGLAVVATLVSRNANTSQVISSASTGFAGALSAAEAPVTGAGGLGSLSGGMTLLGAPMD